MNLIEKLKDIGFTFDNSLNPHQNKRKIRGNSHYRTLNYDY